MTGPFAPVLHADRLPPEFEDQFLLARGPVVLAGAMDEVWHRPRAVAPLLALLARWNVLFPETGRDVPARLAISAAAAEGHDWRRQFRLEPERRFDATLAWDRRRRCLVERTGPFELDWDVRFRFPARMEIETVGAALRLRRIRVPLPRPLVPRVRAVEDALGHGHIRIDLVVRAPWLGPIFGYAGTFTLRPVRASRCGRRRRSRSPRTSPAGAATPRSA